MERVRVQLFLFTSLTIILAAYDQALRVKMRAFSKGTALVFITKCILLSFLMIALCSPAARAQSSVTAASCEQRDVKAVINGPRHRAVNGDTINIPAGTCTWASQLSIKVGITLIGNGTPNSGSGTVGAGKLNTTILDKAPSSGPMINVSGLTTSSSVFRLSTLLIEPYSSSTSLGSPIYVAGTCGSTTCPSLRIDNINFTGWSSRNGISTNWMVRTSNLFGVLDHNTINAAVMLTQPMHDGYLNSRSQYGDSSWSQPDSFGTANNIFVENNTFNSGSEANDCDEGITFENSGGCRIVVRYNNFSGLGSGACCGEMAYFHGTDTTGRPRGGREMEVYGNTGTCTSTRSGCTGVITTLRSGTALVYNNKVTAIPGAWMNSLVWLILERANRPSPSVWAYCDGQSPWDENDGVVYSSGAYTGTTGSTSFVESNQTWTTNEWAGSAVTNGEPYSLVDRTRGFGGEIASNTATTVTYLSLPVNLDLVPMTWTNGDSYQVLRAKACIDQPGRGAGTVFLSGDPPRPTGWVGESIDPIYEWNDSVSGSLFHNSIHSSGSNRLIANRDFYYDQKASFNGTVGTGEGLLSARPSTCTAQVAYWATDTNTLYQCAGTTGSAGTWTGYYQPYTYPHPLTTGSGSSSGSGSSPAPPSGLSAVGQAVVQ